MQFVLTAGHGQNKPGAELDALRDHFVGRGVTRVEGVHDIRRTFGLKGENVGGVELHVVVAERVLHGPTGPDQALVRVHPDEVHVPAGLLGEYHICHKREIASSGATIE